MRICLVIGVGGGNSLEITGGASASPALAEFFRQSGHDVTVLLADLAKRAPNEVTKEWERRGIKVHSLFLENAVVKASFYPDLLKESWLAYHWLKAHAHDAVIFQDDCSVGLLSFQAKKLREAFPVTSLIYYLHGPEHWSSHLLDRRRLVRRDLILPYSVQYGVENADHLVISSSHFLDRIQSSGWRATRSTSVLPYLTEDKPGRQIEETTPSAQSLIFPVHHSDHSAQAIFFQTLGRLARKGGGISLSLLCFGSRREANDVAKRLRSALEGSDGSVRWEVLPENNILKANQKPGLWIFSSFWLDCPRLLLETADRGELILVARTKESERIPRLEACLVDWRMHELGLKLESCWSGQEVPRARGVRREDGAADWSQFLVSLSEPKQETVPTFDEAIRVTICVAHFNKAAYLGEALDSLQAQTFPELEVIVVDDASTDAAAQEAFRSASERFSSPGWIFIQEAENHGPGHARNRAAQMAGGSHLLFFDADDVAFPDMVERLVKAIRQPGVDLVAGSSRRLREVTGRCEMGGTNTYVGGSLENAFLHPPAGTVFLIKKSTFAQVGGFKADLSQDCHEDWNFHIRMLAREYRLHVLPEPVFAYRMAPQSRTQLVTRNMSHNLEPFLESTLQVRKNLLLFALDRAGAGDGAVKMLSEFDHLAGGIRMLRLLERWRQKIRRFFRSRLRE